MPSLPVWPLIYRCPLKIVAQNCQLGGCGQPTTGNQYNRSLALVSDVPRVPAGPSSTTAGSNSSAKCTAPSCSTTPRSLPEPPPSASQHACHLLLRKRIYVVLCVTALSYVRAFHFSSAVFSLFCFSQRVGVLLSRLPSHRNIGPHTVCCPCSDAHLCHRQRDWAITLGSHMQGAFTSGRSVPLV